MIYKPTMLKSANGRDLTNRAIIDVKSIVSGRNCDTLTSITTQMVTSRPFPEWLNNKNNYFSRSRAPLREKAWIFSIKNYYTLPGWETFNTLRADYIVLSDRN